MYVCEGVGKEESAGEWRARALCVCVHVHSERNKLRNLMCVCAYVGRHKKEIPRADIILRVRDGAAVCLCVEPHVGETARWENGWTSGGGGRGKRKFPATRVCVCRFHRRRRHIYLYVYIYRCTLYTAVVALSTSFPARSLHSMNIYIHTSAHIVATVILPQQFPRCTRPQSARTHTAVATSPRRTWQNFRKHFSDDYTHARKPSPRLLNYIYILVIIRELTTIFYRSLYVFFSDYVQKKSYPASSNIMRFEKCNE